MCANLDQKRMPSASHLNFGQGLMLCGELETKYVDQICLTDLSREFRLGKVPVIDLVSRA